MTDHDQMFRTSAIRHVSKPWGYELIFAKTGRYVGKILHINKGESLSLQYHEMKEETLYVVNGELQLTDAIQMMIQSRAVYACAIKGEWHTVGDLLSALLDRCLTLSEPRLLQRAIEPARAPA